MKKIQLISIAILLFLYSSSAQAQKIFELMETDGVNLKEAQDEAATYFSKVGTGKGTGYKLFKRWEYHAKLNLQEDGSLLTEEARAAAIKSSKIVSSRSAKTISQSNWSELGPLAMKNHSTGTYGIGRITAIYVEPVNQQIIYIGSPGGGLWKSINGGDSWTPLGDQFENMKIWAIECDPSNVNTVYYGDALGQLRKSTDGGLTFSTLLDKNGKVRDILINPNNSKEIYVSFNADGIFRTTDGGNTWTEVLEDIVEDILFKPGSTSTIYACGNDFYRSTNGGTSFTKVSNGISVSSRMKMAVSPDNTNYVYIVQAAVDNGFGALYRSTDSGANFNIQSDETTVRDIVGKQSGRDMAITVSTTDINEVHVGGLDLYKSTNAGVSFTQKTDWDNTAVLPYVHADTEVMQYVGNNIYVGCDGGIYKSTNGGSSWTNLSTGLGIQQFYAISNATTNKYIVSGGSQDNGSNVMSGAAHEWKFWSGGDGTSQAIDPNNEEIMYSCAQWGELFKSINGGLSTTDIVDPPESKNGFWVTPIALDPNDSNKIYAGYGDLYRHNNGAISGNWINLTSSANLGNTLLTHIAISQSNSNIVHISSETNIYRSSNINAESPTWETLTFPGNNITNMVVDPYDENRLLVSVPGGSLYYTTDGGYSWTDISSGLPGPTKAMVFDRSSDKGIYVGVNGGIVYYKSNTVTNWTVFSDNLPKAEIRDLELYYDKEVEADSRIRAATFGRGLWESPLYNDEDIKRGSCTDGFNAYTTIQAEDFCLKTTNIKTGNGGTTVGYIQNGSYIRFDNINFGNVGTVSFEAQVSSGASGGDIELRLGNEFGTLIGTCEVGTTGGWTTWDIVSCDVGGITGTQDLYLVFTGGSGYLLDIDWFKFSEIECQVHNAFSVIEAEDSCYADSNITYGEYTNGVTVVENLTDNTWVNYIIDFGTGVDAIEVDIAYTNPGIDAYLELRIGSITGPVIDIVSINPDYSSEVTMQTYTSIFDEIEGVQDVYFTYDSDRPGASFYMDSFTFSSTAVKSFIPDPNKTYYIDATHHNLRLAATGESEYAYTTSISTTGADVEWKFVAKGNGSWHIQRAAGGTLPRLRTDNTITDGTAADMQATTSSAMFTYFDFEEGAIEDTYFITLPDGPALYKRLQVNNGGNVQMVENTRNGTWESFRITEVIESTTNDVPIGQTIWLQSFAHVNYVQNFDSSGDIIEANTSNQGGIWVPFIVEDAEDGLIALKSASNGKYVVADIGLDNTPLIANRDGIGSWEKFYWVNNADGTISLQANSNSLYVCTDKALGPNYPLVANREGIGSWEKFYWGPYEASKELTVEELEKISLFPNPVSTILHIQLPTDGEETVITISNLLGQVLSTNTFDTHEGLNLLKVNIEGFAAGMYTVTILKAQTKLVKKIVVE